MIYVISTGMGDYLDLTGRAIKALNECEIIVGYKKYVGLIEKHFPNKKFISYSMREEVARCEFVLKIAHDENKNVGLISGGDAGIYGMAGLVLELSGKDDIIKIIPGLTSATAAAALLGAPLSNDFAVISLSDLLTPQEVILKRVKCSCDGDFVICFYNPGSERRRELFKQACSIIMEYREKNTPAAIVTDVSREGQECKILTISEIQNYEPKMNQTIIIGNSKTFNRNGKIITPRGYKI